MNTHLIWRVKLGPNLMGFWKRKEYRACTFTFKDRNVTPSTIGWFILFKHQRLLKLVGVFVELRCVETGGAIC